MGKAHNFAHAYRGTRIGRGARLAIKRLSAGSPAARAIAPGGAPARSQGQNAPAVTTLARRADKPGLIAVNVEEDVARSAAIVQAAGYRLIPLAHAIGPWAILGACSQGLLLVAIVRDAWPATGGGLWGHPAGWPVNTRRLIHHWIADKLLPEALSL
jgi:hypothetical protein